MTEWYEKAYSGAPMVKVAGFPRPLYPPNSTYYGKTPSSDGPDVKAYKRTVSRAGRWKWQKFDDTFSNNFSQGKPESDDPDDNLLVAVGDSGIVGIQMQQKIDATGWVGEKTFNTLRSIVIPAELPHAGEMAMDATAVKLINEAWGIFGGQEPPPVEPDTLRVMALKEAIAELGTKESPANSNKQKYGSWYGMNAQPWCAMFVTWCFEQVGDSPAFLKGSRYAYVPYVVGDAREGRNGLKTTDDPIPGDLVCYDWNWNGEYDHIGIFEYWKSNDTFSAIEGNTSYSDNSNGGEVMRRDRNKSSQGTVFVRVQEP
jgi:CHAP domain